MSPSQTLRPRHIAALLPSVASPAGPHPTGVNDRQQRLLLRRPVCGSTRERRLGLILVVVAHTAGVFALSQLGGQPVRPPTPPIMVSLITPAAVVAEQPAGPQLLVEMPPDPPADVPPTELTPPEAKPIPVPPPTPKPVAEPPPPVPAVAPPPRPAPPRPEPPKVERKPEPRTPPPTERPPATTTAMPSEAVPTPAQPAAPATTSQAPAAASAAPVPQAPPPITAPRFDAAYLNNPTPPYPPLSRRMREEGTVMLRVFVGSDGRPERIELSASSGSSRLDAAAQTAVSRWRFVPARQGDREIASWVVVPVIFKLEG